MENDYIFVGLGRSLVSTSPDSQGWKSVHELPPFPLAKHEITITLMGYREKPRRSILPKEAQVLWKIGLTPTKEMVGRTSQHMSTTGLQPEVEDICLGAESFGSRPASRFHSLFDIWIKGT